MTNQHTSWIIKGDEVGYKSNADDQSFGMFCPVAIITDMDQIGLIAAAPETAAERDRLKEINAELLAAVSELVSIIWGIEPATTIDGCYTNDPSEQKARAAIAKATGGQNEF